MEASSQALFHDTVGVMTVILAIPVLFLWLERRVSWKIFDVLPPIIWIFLLPIALSNLGVIPRESPVYDTFKGFAVPMFIVLMLLDINIRETLRVSWRGLGVMVFGAFGIVLGAVVAFALFRTILPAGTALGFGALAGSWIGGTGNLAAVAESLRTPGEMVGVVVIVDNFVYLLYFPIILTCKRWATAFNRFSRVSQAEIDHLTEAAADVEKKRHEVHFRDLLTLLGVGFAALLAANFLAPRVTELLLWLADRSAVLKPVLGGMAEVFSDKTWSMLLVTTFGILLSGTSLKKVPGTEPLAMTFVYITMTMIGASADLRNLGGAWWFLVAGALCIFVHFVVLIAAARLFRVDVSMAATASVAAVGGAASAPVAASFHREELVPVSIMLALVGYALGNYLGVLTAYLCSLLA